MGEALNKAQYNENSQEEPNSEKKPSEIEGKAEISSKEKETIKISKEEKELAKQKDKEEYERVHALVESARDTAQNTVKNISETLATIDSTIKGIKDTEKMFEDHDKRFNNAFALMAEKLTEAFSTKEEPEFIGIPEYSDIQSISELLVTQENILVIIGEEVSEYSHSNIFRDFTLTFDKMREDFENARVIMEEMRETLDQIYPNKLHFVFARLLAFSKIIDIKLSFLNMSPDGLLGRAYDEIVSLSLKNSVASKGSKEEDEEERKISDSKEFDIKEEELDIIDFFGDIRDDRKIQLNEEGKSIVVPRIYLQGESVSEFHPNLDDITDRLRTAQVLVIAGTIPEDSFLHAIIGNFIEFGIPIVELGERPQLEVGCVYKVVGELGEILFSLEKCIQESYSILSGVEASNFYLF